MLRRQLELGVPIEGIGMQFHAFCGRDNEVSLPVYSTTHCVL